MVPRNAYRPAARGRTWQVQEAKARFSELFQRVRSEGAQRVSRHGKEVVVILTEEEFERLTERRANRGSLVDFFARSPLAKNAVTFEREPGRDRPVDL
jgi:prevent-host-death family protein